MTLGNKKDIVKAFREETDETPDVDRMDPIDLDKALLAMVMIAQTGPTMRLGARTVLAQRMCGNSCTR